MPVADAARIVQVYVTVPAPSAWLGGDGDGAQGRNRTTDTAIFSRMLYQLSYLGAGPLPILHWHPADQVTSSAASSSVVSGGAGIRY